MPPSMLIREFKEGDMPKICHYFDWLFSTKYNWGEFIDWALPQAHRLFVNPDPMAEVELAKEEAKKKSVQYRADKLNNMTPGQLAEYKEGIRQYNANYRAERNAVLSEGARRNLLDVKNLRNRERKARRTPAQIEADKARDAAGKRSRYGRLSASEKKNRRDRSNERRRIQKLNETPDQRKKRLEQKKEQRLEREAKITTEELAEFRLKTKVEAQQYKEKREAKMDPEELKAKKKKKLARDNETRRIRYHKEKQRKSEASGI